MSRARRIWAFSEIVARFVQAKHMNQSIESKGLMGVSYHFSLDVINIVILVYLMIDAPKHGKNALLWGILGFLFGPFTLCVYLLKTDRTTWGYAWLVVSLLYLLTIVGLSLYILRTIFHFV